MENLAYTIVQVVHNFGAVAVAGGSIFALFPITQHTNVQRQLALIVGAGWLVQGMSGLGFAVTSYYFYNTFPELDRSAQAALFIKIICATSGLIVATKIYRRLVDQPFRSRKADWGFLVVFGATSLICAAILRWYS